MINLHVRGRVFDVPRIFFTIDGQGRGKAVVRFIAHEYAGEHLRQKHWAAYEEWECANRPTDEDETGVVVHLFQCLAYIATISIHWFKFVEAEEELLVRGKALWQSAQDCRIFKDGAEVREYFQGGVSPNSAVVLFDTSGGQKCYSMVAANRAKSQYAIPGWAGGAFWGVAMHEGSERRKGRRLRQCSEFLRAIFVREFKERLAARRLPWGPCRKNESSPEQVTLPDGTAELVRRLNDGPNLAAAIAATEYALELPTNSRISWVRVTGEPATCDEPALLATTQALQSLQRATGTLLREQPAVRELLLAGVDLPDPRLTELYLDPPRPSFTVDRPDLHLTEDGLSPSEMDEMPGGMPEACHIDRCYGVNQERWKWFFEWLTSLGPTLFIVSHEWSKVYVPEVRWLVDYIRSLGHDVHFTTTDELSGLEVEADGVSWQGTRLGTIWRLFPIFETAGKLVEVVAAAAAGKVRLVPEFGFMGNKTLFALFRRFLGFFQERLNGKEFDLLRQILPDSSLVRPGTNSFPLRISSGGVGFTVNSMADLHRLPTEWRDKVVMKVAGANTRSARSYGVLMGTGLTDEAWQTWLRDRTDARQPFLVQSRFRTRVTRLGVLHTKRGVPEAFDCRLLARPWVVDGRIVSIHGCAVPRTTERVHGMVDMAIVPFNLGPFPTV